MAQGGNNPYGIPVFDIEHPPQAWPARLTKGGKSFVESTLRDYQAALQKSGSVWVREATELANQSLDKTLQLLQPVATAAATKTTPPGQFGKLIPADVRGALQNHFNLSVERDDESVARVATVEIYVALRELRNGKWGLNASKLTYEFDGLFCSKSSAAYTNPILYRNTIVICPFSFELAVPPWKSPANLTGLANTLIHENAHRLGKPGDIYKVDHAAKYKNLSISAALSNADSYSHFVMELAGHAEGE